ncbi:uncharacterized protein CC84DRAFT_1216089 [Paraphaeosphaeria sporulosa]|uniref:Uncharacterized protein n=1 Tax=Paraphaeosphaeria sporulosa TaxID=1460663 RepID=A0A177CHS4_9PLEO|nr:uncharacterized protein CC84DRAFT_1216089 [Paraphaeosphaeria sporulosa]OAG07084.1 hypothetical protein CC84DRAFT_1216089 [Paraphaeosphaeria sporulosa]
MSAHKVPQWPPELNYGPNPPRPRTATTSVAQLDATHNQEATKEAVPQKRTAEELLEQKRSKLQKQHENLNAYFNAEKEEYKQISTLLQQEKLTSFNTIKHLEQEKDQLRSELDSKTKLTTSLDTDLQRVMKDLKSWKEECETRDAEMKEANAKMDRLEGDNYQLKQDLAKNKKALEARKSFCDKKEAIIRDMTDNANNCRQVLAAKEKEMQEKESDKVHLKERLRNSDLALESRNKEIRQKNEEIAGLSAIRDSILKVAAEAQKTTAGRAEKSAPALPPARTVTLPSTRAANSAHSRK